MGQLIEDGPVAYFVAQEQCYLLPTLFFEQRKTGRRQKQILTARSLCVRSMDNRLQVTLLYYTMRDLQVQM